MMTQQSKEEIAFIELKNQMVEIMFSFTDKYASQSENSLYPHAGHILVQVLVDCLAEAEYQIMGCARFTRKQIDHICYQIGEWYIDMKPLLEGQHNLGYMKEKLKLMVCGE